MITQIPTFLRRSAALSAVMAGIFCTVAQAQPVDLGGMSLAGVWHAPRLVGPTSVATTSHGRYVYLASPARQTIEVLARVRGSGRLRRIGCVAQTGSETRCATTARGLGRPINLVLSPDGRNLYAASPSTGTLAVLVRNRRSGMLRSAGCVRDLEAVELCAASIAAFAGPDGLAVSPDGRNVYVGSLRSNTVVTFARDLRSGALTAIGCVSAPESREPCSGTAAGIALPASLTVTPDGRGVYVVGYGALAAFARDSITGALTPAGCVRGHGYPISCAAKVGAFGGRGVVASSPDSRFVYVATHDGNSVWSFARDLARSGLTPAGCVELTGGPTCEQTTGGLGLPVALAMSPDGAQLWVASQTSSALTLLGRDPGTGALSPAGCVSDSYRYECALHVGGLGAPEALALTADGQRLYLAAGDPSGLLAFGRSR